ncbi:MAG: MATE family efflux transporter [Bacteroidales bacterium]|nr:MATE family efflux transporter [Bacteroidales bacterium]
MKRLLYDIWESITGTEQDFTSGKLGRAILLLSVPMVLEMVMESIFAIVDIFFVSKLGPDAVATVGITESLITIVYAIAVGLSMATTALVARRIGEKRPEKAAEVAFQAIITGLVISFMIAWVGWFFAPELLMLMGISHEMAQDMSGYTAWMIGGNTVIMMLFIINAVFRSAGDAAISLRVLLVANTLNIFLDPCLIFGIGPFPELGITGAAIATNIGRGIAVVYQLYLLFGKKHRIKLSRASIKVDFRIIREIIRISAGGIMQTLIATSSWIGMVRILSVFGNEVLAGYTIAIRLIIFALLPSWGVSNAAATLVGQNLGAGKPERAERAVWFTGLVNVILLGSIGVFFVFWPGFFMSIFIQDNNVVEYGSVALRIISYGFLAYGLGMVMIQSFNGAGDTSTPTWINFFCFWMLEIPLAYSLSLTMGFGEDGVFYAILSAETVMTILAVILFMRGKWKLKKV